MIYLCWKLESFSVSGLEPREGTGSCFTLAGEFSSSTSVAFVSSVSMVLSSTSISADGTGWDSNLILLHYQSIVVLYYQGWCSASNTLADNEGCLMDTLLELVLTGMMGTTLFWHYITNTDFNIWWHIAMLYLLSK